MSYLVSFAYAMIAAIYCLEARHVRETDAIRLESDRKRRSGYIYLFALSMLYFSISLMKLPAYEIVASLIALLISSDLTEADINVAVYI